MRRSGAFIFCSMTRFTRIQTVRFRALTARVCPSFFRGVRYVFPAVFAVLPKSRRSIMSSVSPYVWLAFLRLSLFCPTTVSTGALGFLPWHSNSVLDLRVLTKEVFGTVRPFYRFAFRRLSPSCFTKREHENPSIEIKSTKTVKFPDSTRTSDRVDRGSPSPQDGSGPPGGHRNSVEFSATTSAFVCDEAGAANDRQR
jgi:hypothetical protein